MRLLLSDKGRVNFFEQKANVYFAILVLVVYLAGQLLIGTISPDDSSYHLTSPAHMDFVYYLSIAKQIAAHVPPQNPAYGDIIQTQPWIHFLPLTALSKIIDPYLSLKILNIIYVICFMFILRKYLPETWGLISFVFLCGSTMIYWYGYPANPLAKKITDTFIYNPASIDLLARSFTHMPFFILFMIVLFESDRTWLAVVSAVSLGWVDGLMAMSAFFGLMIYLILRKDLRTLLLVAAIFSGLLTNAISFGRASGTIAETFLNGIRFEPLKPIAHIYLFVPLLLLARDKKFWSLFVASFILCAFVQFHSYHFIFTLNLATTFLVVDSLRRYPEKGKPVFNIIICIAFGFFLLYSCGKYNPGHPVDPYVPFNMEPYNESLEWISNNTDPRAIFLVLPSVSITDIPIVQQERAVYLGNTAYARFLGINTRERARKAYAVYYRSEQVPKEVDYVYYGPRELKVFPDFRPDLGVVYRDNWVTIFDTKK